MLLSEPSPGVRLDAPHHGDVSACGSTSQGPLNDSKEIVVGFYVPEAPDLEAAMALTATNPALEEGGGVEARPVHSSGVAG